MLLHILFLFQSLNDPAVSDAVVYYTVYLLELAISIPSNTDYSRVSFSLIICGRVVNYENQCTCYFQCEVNSINMCIKEKYIVTTKVYVIQFLRSIT